MSATQRRSGDPGAKLRFTRSGAGGVRSVCERTVVRAFLLRPPHPNSPASRISLATRFLEHLTRGVCPSPSRWRSVSPTVEAALGDLQRPAHGAHPVVRLLRLDERVGHLRARRSSSLAKNVAAFLGSRAPL